MRILPFPQPAKPRGQFGAGDWSQQELADFYRAHRLLSEQGVRFGIDRGTTDAGDPWMVLYDESSHEVFMHIARLDNRCILICEQLDLHLRRATIDELIGALEEALRDIFTMRSQRNDSNVLLHPASRLIMSLSAIFLIFKLENGDGAQAKAWLSDHTPPDAATRKSDIMGLASRASATLGRIFDISDAPTAAAALASVILSVELARLHLSEGDQPNQHLSDHQIAQERSGLKKALSSHVEQPKDLHDAHLQLSDINIQDQFQDSDGLTQFELITLTSHSVETLITEENTLHQTDIEPVLASLNARNSAPPSQAKRAAIDSSDTPPSKEVVTAVNGSAQTNKLASSDHPSDGQAQMIETTTSLAQEAIESLLIAKPPTSGSGSADFILTADPIQDKAAPTATISNSIGNISLANIEALSHRVGFFEETTLTGDMLTDRLNGVRDNIGNLDIEFDSTRFLVEQHAISNMDAGLIGLWINIMPDGSSITVIGELSMFDHLGLNVA